MHSPLYYNHYHLFWSVSWSVILCYLKKKTILRDDCSTLKILMNFAVSGKRKKTVRFLHFVAKNGYIYLLLCPTKLNNRNLQFSNLHLFKNKTLCWILNCSPTILLDDSFNYTTNYDSIIFFMNSQCYHTVIYCKQMNLAF